jgi:hypothetical protein
MPPRRDDLFDPSLIDEMLALTPAERIARHEQALALVLTLEEAGKRHRESQARPAAPADPLAG